MSNFPPLPRYLTLEEAAQAMTDRTGKQWTPRQILGCAERHEITIFARISHAVKFVRVRPVEGRTNEIAADKGSLPILDTEAIRALLLAGEAHSTGWEEPATVDFFGEPVEAWQKVFELAPGEDAPLVRPDGCRVTAAGILQLVDTHTTPAQAEPQAAPMVAANAEQRQARRWQMCIDAGLPMPQDTYAQLPRGIKEIAKAENITRQALAQDLNAHRERLFGK